MLVVDACSDIVVVVVAEAAAAAAASADFLRAITEPFVTLVATATTSLDFVVVVAVEEEVFDVEELVEGEVDVGVDVDGVVVVASFEDLSFCFF